MNQLDPTTVFPVSSDPQDERLDFGSWALEAKHHPMFFALRRDLFRLYISIFLGLSSSENVANFFFQQKNIYLSPAIWVFPKIGVPPNHEF